MTSPQESLKVIPKATYYMVALYSAIICLLSISAFLLTGSGFFKYLQPVFADNAEIYGFLDLLIIGYNDPLIATIGIIAFGTLPMMLLPVLFGQCVTQRILGLKLPSLQPGDFHQILVYSLVGDLVGGLVGAFLFYTIRNDVRLYLTQRAGFPMDEQAAGLYLGLAVGLFCLTTLSAAIWFTGGLMKDFPRDALPAWALSRVRRYEKKEHSIK